MADFLLLLGKLNLAMGTSIIVIYLLRRMLRVLFGAPIAYAIWLLVPIAGVAILLPPRTTAPPPTHLPPAQYTFAPLPVTPAVVIKQVVQPALRITERLAGRSVQPLIVAQPTASDSVMPSYALLLLVAWVLGAALMALYMARLQARFHAAVRLGEAGPAVLGIFRPRIIIPNTFQEQFTALEQAAIFAHERVHLARYDACINALAALLRCLCWFNPLIHLGAAWLRTDQELACDATTVAGPISRRDYANALVKSQMMMATLPLGCNWPGSQHPLIERIALLKRKRPGTIRRITGTGLIFLAVTSAGLGAWAAQPPVTTGFSAVPQLNRHLALAKRSAMTAASNQDAVDAGPTPITSVNPARGNEVRPPRHLSRLFHAEELLVAPPDLSRLLPKETLVTPTLVASNDPPTTRAELTSKISSAAVVALNDQPDAQAEAAKASECARPKLLNSLPMEKVPDSDTMMVIATIDGSPEKLLVGIGGPSQLWSTLAAKLRLPVLEGRRYMDFGGRFSEDVARVARLTLGSMETGGFDIGVSPDPNFAHAAFNGVLGTDMMQRYDVDLDFAHQKLNYFSPEQCNAAGIYWDPSTITSVRMAAYTGLVYVPVTLDGHKIIALLDTSADRTFLNPQVASKLFGLKADSLEAANVTDGGTHIRAGMYRFSRLILGGLTAYNPQIAVPFDTMTQSTREFHAEKGVRDRYHLSEIMPDLVIGMDVLKHSHLYISFRNQLVYVSAAQDGPALNAALTETSWLTVWEHWYETSHQPFVEL